MTTSLSRIFAIYNGVSLRYGHIQLRFVIFLPHYHCTQAIAVLTLAYLRYGKVMALHLVGVNIDRQTAHARAQAGGLIRIVKGIYVDAETDVSRVVREHALRIAAFLYPNTYLAGITAQIRQPTEDGRLFLSGRRNQRTRIREFEIIQNVAPDAPSTVPVLVEDALGEMTLAMASPKQRFLEAFRRQSELAAAIDTSVRRQMADRLIEEFGSADLAADALWRVARPNRWTAEAEAAEAYLRLPAPGGLEIVNQANLNLTVAWHGTTIGSLSHDGAEWRWIATQAPNLVAHPPLIRLSRPGNLPPFIDSLLPEGWLAQVLKDRNPREILRSGRRYMSNISIVADAADLGTIPADVLKGRLAHFSVSGLFTGRYRGPASDRLNKSFQENLAQLFASAGTPRLSGVQIKAPMFLEADGTLIAAVDRPFTHILKPAGTNGFEALPVVEWVGMTLAKSIGFEVPEIALIPMPDGLAPALLVERFDIRRSDNDQRLLAMEDFCSILELPADRKYEGTIERMARGLRSLSTQPEDDLKILFQRALFAWFIGDGDMHLKNMALLKMADPGATTFRSVRFAPVYDTVTTRVFPLLANDHMALKLNGKDDRLTPKDFLELARVMELPLQWASGEIAELARNVSAASLELGLPERLAVDWDREVDRIRSIVAERTDIFV
jgi:serine/threonine-protein kinase HipA